jgi:hypothetical protein
MIILKRIDSYTEGHTMVHVNPHKIEMMYMERFTSVGKVITTTRLVFNRGNINVLESPDEIEELIRNYNE